MAIRFSQLPSISSGHLVRLAEDRPITDYITDSRKAVHRYGACFFAIQGPRYDGHQFIDTLYAGGIRQFVVEKDLTWEKFPDANFFIASSSLQAIQQLAAYHRKQFPIPIIAITGSNAKTIIKEWIYQLLSSEFSIAKNPGSYNSQLGVPLSVLGIRDHHTLGVFEAGISKVGEMSNLASIIQPTIGLFTNIGSSHDEGFKDRSSKIREKLLLFQSCKTVIYCSDHQDIHREATQMLKDVELLSWGSSPSAAFKVNIVAENVEIKYKERVHKFTLPFSRPAQIENAIHCIALMLHMGKADSNIASGLKLLKSVPMRMELKQGINNCLVIDDTYNNDLAGLQISLDFLAGQQKSRKVLILSDILESGLKPEDMVKQIAGTLASNTINELIAVGPALSTFRKYLPQVQKSQFYPDTKAFLTDFPASQFRDAAILVKGARPFQFENIVARLERKVHGTVMEIDLVALVNNLNFFKAKLRPQVKLMVMVKALAYGSGSEEVATLLQYHHVDYLGVAYPDEGAELRRSNITLPIMVMNPTVESFQTLVDYQLEPEIYNIRMLRSLVEFLDGRPCSIHLKIDSGMHRLGFNEREIDDVISILREQNSIRVASVFTHLAGSDDAEHDMFTKQQAAVFERASQKLSTSLNINPIRHVLNSPGILRFPDLQFDMVRLGIGLYGINPTTEDQEGLEPVVTLKTIISQIKSIPAGDTIGYGRRAVAKSEMKLATIAIGYADGFSRAHSRGVGEVLINGKRAPVVGNVCMDMTMVDITGIEAQEGDEVVIFGKSLPIGEVAARVGTIPYEILTSTSERVRRVFHTESV